MGSTVSYMGVWGQNAIQLQEYSVRYKQTVKLAVQIKNLSFPEDKNSNKRSFDLQFS